MQNNALRIAIIGAGASGSLLTMQLCRQSADRPLHITLIDKTGHEGTGLAYSTTEPLHLLNVPAGKMSAFPDLPTHFIDWLKAQGLNFVASDFVPRGLFGEYLQSVLAEALAACPDHVRPELLMAEVNRISLQEKTALLVTTNGQTIEADLVVLALGNFPPAHPCPALAKMPPGPHYASDPWDRGILERLQPADPVLLIGTGLTMVDVVMSLHSRGHQGPVKAISTHGHLPDVHELTEPYKGVSEEVARVSCVKEWLSYIRNHALEANRQGISGQAVVDAFRPYSQAFWLQLSLAEKKRFMRHLRHLWAVSRHRMPPASAAVIGQLRHTGQLSIVRGTIAKVESFGKTVLATIRDRKGSFSEFSAKLIINCTGPQADYQQVPSELLQNLLSQGLAKPDDLLMGFAATPQGELIAADGQKQEIFYSLGPPLKGILWESTAIPEIRQQAQNLAGLLLQK